MPILIPKFNLPKVAYIFVFIMYVLSKSVALGTVWSGSWENLYVWLERENMCVMKRRNGVKYLT